MILKKNYGLVSSYFVTDLRGNKKPLKSKNGNQLYNVNGSITYEVIIKRNANRI